MCQKVGSTRSGLVLVEMSPAEWQRLRHPGDTPASAGVQRVIGADLGWRDYRTSLALLDFTGDRPALLDTFQARTTDGGGNDAWFARLGEVAGQVDAWLQTALADGVPTGFAFEAVYLENNPTVTIGLATLGGLLAGLARARGCPVARVYPVQAKTALAGSAKAGKSAMMEASGRLFGLTTDQHLADAIGVALHGEAVLRQRRLTGSGEVIDG